jgi:hypothetical protein
MALLRCHGTSIEGDCSLRQVVLARHDDAARIHVRLYSLVLSTMCSYLCQGWCCSFTIDYAAFCSDYAAALNTICRVSDELV